MSQTLHGVCHCGAISLTAEVDAPNVLACHCTDCRTISGAPFRAIVAVPAEHLTVTGQPKEYVKVADSGNRRFQAFCGDCGTQLYACDENRTLFNVRTGWLDQFETLAPQTHIFGKSAPSWIHQLNEGQWRESGPQSPEMPPIADA